MNIKTVSDFRRYATDGKCHNVEPGTYGHECGKPAEFIGTTAKDFRSGFCRKCKEHGYEARGVVKWEKLFTLPAFGHDYVR